MIAGALPTVSFTSDGETGCAPLQVTYTDTSTEEPTSRSWEFEGGTPATSTDQMVTVTYDTPGTYAVSLSVTNIYGSTDQTFTDYVVVEAEPGTPEFTITTDDEITYTFTVDNPVAGWSYSWAFGDGDFADGTEVSQTYLADGPFEVNLIVTNDCGSSTAIKTVNPVISSVETPAWAFDLILAPNPTSDQLFLRATNWPTNGELSFRLVNALGQHLRLDNRNVQTGNWQEPLDLSRYPAGTYWLQISWSGEMWTQKVIKL
jgi:PKD repeat protein